MKNQLDHYEIVIYGAGAVGASICGWLTPVYKDVYLLARGDNAQAIKSNGLIMYQDSIDNKKIINVNVIENLNERPITDILVLTVKNYDLEEVAKDIYSKLGDKPIIVALQNGVENQSILPKYFSKIIYGVIMFNAWREKPGIFGYVIKGYILIGTLDNSLQPEMQKLKKAFGEAIRLRSSPNIQDAIHTKLVFNLSNSILTLINYSNLSKEVLAKFGNIYYNTLAEGIKVLEVAGYKEHRLPGLAPWDVIKGYTKESDEKLGEIISNMMTTLSAVTNSMAQDIIMRQKSESELEHLNGYILTLAKKFNIPTPYNTTIYELCKLQFQKQPFTQLDVDYVWNIIQSRINA
jgi:2-dehydropantoate 2-reductase